jgi:hypothetical protein
MDKNYFIQLTSNLYNLTLLFPEKEPLRYKMRELSNEVLKDITSADFSFDGPSKKQEKNNSQLALENLKILDSFFEVAKTQNWVSISDILNLQQEYSKLNEEIERFNKNDKNFQGQNAENKISEKKEKISKISILERQERILEILQEKEKAQVHEVKEVFPEITKRTLRRDFEFLLKKGLVRRKGERNNTFYQLKW